jgi:hypothetical protein
MEVGYAIQTLRVTDPLKTKDLPEQEMPPTALRNDMWRLGKVRLSA